jgi:RNA polymerase sigma factor (sigma-70 family)
MSTSQGSAGTAIAAPQTGIEPVLRGERQKLLNYIRQRVGSDEDAEDLLQDVYLNLLASPSVTEPIQNLTAWLFTAARNRIIDWYRRRKPDPWGDPELEGFWMPEELLVDPVEGPEGATMRSFMAEELADALAELPTPQREVFEKHELEGRSFKEMADETGTPINTLLSRKRYAVLALRERLKDLYDELQEP